MVRSLPRCSRFVLLLALAPVAAAGGEPEPAIDPRATALRREGLALAVRDDSASLERSATLLAEASQLEPRLFQARADRALVEFLLAAARREQAAWLPSVGDSMVQSGRELRERALEEMRPLAREHAGDFAVTRALAVYYGLDGREAETARILGQAGAAGRSDPWFELAQLAADLGAAGRERAIPRIAAFVAARPELLRARMMLAGAQYALSRTDDAVTTLDALLDINPDHDGALRLKERILSPPPARVAVVPVPQAAPPPRPHGYLPRKPSGARKDAARGRAAPSDNGAAR